ncbi:hypothetical protein KQ939_05625 [Planococcus sp. CP5-4]|uniref:hypothetical protein n=1 Tax=unclassified Planococcus (in: firmicutes) TaxID=2662419 RepID=UPI001C22552B|nr:MULTISPECIES: hypothetical protein [unclassified Planococcus (in: firmicutes)]MBU9673742.1 hypothetical protein [Planococcus sp. CP5-4_YE]MBV0908032.1 hypothetical protein [Planococcus sp. CP5-4_UN]MBW6063199.1 hypothetical protein [Planococcus sp. CP5-4]
MKTIAGFVFLMGIILFFADTEVLAPLGGFAVYFIVGGLVMLAIAQLAGNREKNWRCRIGFHDFERKERVEEVPAMRWYRCKRCGKEKRAASIV